MRGVPAAGEVVADDLADEIVFRGRQGVRGLLLRNVDGGGRRRRCGGAGRSGGSGHSVSGRARAVETGSLAEGVADQWFAATDEWNGQASFRDADAVPMACLLHSVWLREGGTPWLLLTTHSMRWTGFARLRRTVACVAACAPGRRCRPLRGRGPRADCLAAGREAAPGRADGGRPGAAAMPVRGHRRRCGARSRRRGVCAIAVPAGRPRPSHGTQRRRACPADSRRPRPREFGAPAFQPAGRRRQPVALGGLDRPQSGRCAASCSARAGAARSATSSHPPRTRACCRPASSSRCRRTGAATSNSTCTPAAPCAARCGSRCCGRARRCGSNSAVPRWARRSTRRCSLWRC